MVAQQGADATADQLGYLVIDSRRARREYQRMRWLIALFSCLTPLLVLPQAAYSSRAIPGGHYVGRTRLANGVRIIADLQLANDGKEFADSSAVSAEIPCAETTYEDALLLSSFG